MASVDLELGRRVWAGTEGIGIIPSRRKRPRQRSPLRIQLAQGVSSLHCGAVTLVCKRYDKPYEVYNLDPPSPTVLTSRPGLLMSPPFSKWINNQGLWCLEKDPFRVRRRRENERIGKVLERRTSFRCAGGRREFGREHDIKKQRPD